MNYGKGFNNGNDDDVFVPAGTKTHDFIPIGRENEYIKVGGEYYKKSTVQKLKDQQSK